MVCMDGWVLTHSYEPVEFVDQEKVDQFLPPFKPEHFLDVADPKTWGSYAEGDVLMEFKYAIQKAMIEGKAHIRRILAELAALTGRDYGGLVEAYRTDDADVVLVAMGSVAGTIKDALDDLRQDGKRVGLVRIRCYRPFPHEDLLAALGPAKIVAVLDANVSIGSEGAVGLDIKSKLANRPGAPMVVDFIAGLGGREVNAGAVRRIVDRAERILSSGVPISEAEWLDLNPAIVP
jgi:pyruvate ferredoxin oxidoreductase alpha subunit